MNEIIDNVKSNIFTTAPEGCLQYFQDREGTITSFNWDGLNSRQYMPNQHYSICFKRGVSDCQVDIHYILITCHFRFYIMIILCYNLFVNYCTCDLLLGFSKSLNSRTSLQYLHWTCIWCC